MKKPLLIIAAVLIVITASAQELLLNSGFETAKVNGIFGAQFEDWTIPSITAIETSDKAEGTQALKIVEAPKALNKIEQQVFDYANHPEEGATYVMKIKYKVLTSQGGEDIKIDACWSTKTENESKHDSALLKTGFFTASEWTEKIVETTCPAAGKDFMFRVSVAKNVVALFDDFSFVKKGTVPGDGNGNGGGNEGGNEGGTEGDNGGGATGTPTLTVNATLPALYGAAGETYSYPVVEVVHKHLQSPLTVDIRGANRDQFTFELKTKNDTLSEIHIAYKPTKAGTHKGMLVIESEKHPELSYMQPLEAYSIDKTNPPLISVAPNSIPKFEIEEKKDSVFKIRLKSERCIQMLSAKMVHKEKAGFIVQSSAFPKNIEQTVEITFSPKTTGNYKSELMFYTYGADTVKLTLTGYATASKTDPEAFDKEFNWDMSNPRKLYIEDFEGTIHNHKLECEGSQNVVVKGNRGWWGYAHKDSKGNIEERSAKATGYEYQVPSAGNRAEMWFVTPALDYKNAANKVFTMRMMGDFMHEGHDTRMTVYLIDSVPGDKMIMSPIEGLVQTSPDFNGEWNEYHLNLGDYQIADVFWMAFKYEGKKGQENPVVYYVDDLSWGRTDLPQIMPDSTKIEMTADLNKDKLSGFITVKARNLKQEITLSLGGPNKSKFKLTQEKLPKEGGIFNVAFHGEEAGVHEAYVKLSSRGAADVYIPMAVLCKNTTAIDMTESKHKVWADDSSINILSDDVEQAEVYSIDGKLVASKAASSGLVTIQVATPGIYVVKVKSAKGTDMYKLAVK